MKTCIVVITLLLFGCATANMLPKNADGVNFDAVGYVQGEGWHDGAIYNASLGEIEASIIYAYKANGMKIKENLSEVKNALFAQQLPNLYRWSTFVGTYYRSVGENKTEVHVVALGTKDVNAFASDSKTPLPPKIMASIGASLSRIQAK